jgi:RHH-type proline utilization regulon transcriptional repressor/proline dehydrogenase/delta 1-pyrroline-5-carboxylate dehydrogenase
MTATDDAPRTTFTATADPRAAELRAQALLTRALATTSRSERRRSQRLGRLLADDAGRDLLLDLTDQVLRIRDRKRAARRLHDLVRAGVPRSLGVIDGLGLRMLGMVAPYSPRLAEWAVDWRVSGETRGVILPAEDVPFGRYIKQRTSEGFDININVLGEAILGDDEADARFSMVTERIRRPDVNYVSIKISALCANLDVLAWDDSLERISDRLSALYRVAAAHGAFVNLDMEEHRDLDLSVEAFIRVLDMPEFHNYRAGIVLQAYVPDSHGALKRLCDWANERVASGGAGIKIRLVKGANLAMEQVEAEQRDWPQAPYYSKADVDASYKLLLRNALEWAKPDAVRLGVASHNLFDVAWALTLRDSLGDPRRIEIEMLEGMAPAQSRAVRDEAGSLLLYSPVVEKRDRDASIAYLSRRLDENSGPENFLRALFDLTPDSPQWQAEVDRFYASLQRADAVETTSHRDQDRRNENLVFASDGTFACVADTDFTTPGNRAWAEAILKAPRPNDPPLISTVAQVDDIVARANQAQESWRNTSWQERREVLARIATEFATRRGEFLSIMATTTGKTLREGDPEISEAIDFTTYAAHLTLAQEARVEGLEWNPHAVTLVAGPWNFPFAIPTAGLVHAVAAGGAAILKPAPEARAVGAAIIDAMVTAGVPADLVQLACTPDNEVGAHLVTHAAVDQVILTGSLATAEMFQGWRPDLMLRAETSGKNALIITAAADLDLAIKDLVRSAFGHAGQKCSAASLAIVEASVYDDPSFRVRLADAVRSMRAGSATDPATIVGPIINQPQGNLLRALTDLEPGESWLVEPRQLAETPFGGTVWSPGVRWDVQPQSWFHLTECFGPVLGIMRADDLTHALALQNATDYGLTGGIHSLDPAEITTWLAQVEVGNAYVNRHITGAIVQRQPFGGWKASSIGPGAKPGGPHYLDTFGTWRDPQLDVSTAQTSLRDAWANHYSKDHDPTGLRSEHNILRYRPLSAVLVRTASDTSDTERAIVTEASRLSGTRLIWSTPGDGIEQQLPALGIERIRLLGDSEPDFLAAAHSALIAVDTAPVTGDGYTELAHWVKEQSISITRHRHGRLLA